MLTILIIALPVLLADVVMFLACCKVSAQSDARAASVLEQQTHRSMVDKHE